LRIFAARPGGARLVGVGYELEERLEHHPGRVDEAVVHLVGDLRPACLAATGLGQDDVDPFRNAIKPELRVSYGIEAVIGFGGRGLI
jgi:hypothetical protein